MKPAPVQELRQALSQKSYSNCDDSKFENRQGVAVADGLGTGFLEGLVLS